MLATIRARLAVYEANHWLPNIETAKRQIKELEAVIKKLEEADAADMDTAEGGNGCQQEN